MKRELLEKPFTPAQIRQRKGRNGMLDYVEGHTVIQRLNEALEGEWSFEIMHHEVWEEEVLVVGKLSAGPVVKMAFGGSQVTRERESGSVVSLGDDLKAAATDALKKCATFLGAGLHLYADKPIGGRAPAPRSGASAPTRGEHTVTLLKDDYEQVDAKVTVYDRKTAEVRPRPSKLGRLCEEVEPPLQRADGTYWLACHIPLEDQRRERPVRPAGESAA